MPAPIALAPVAWKAAQLGAVAALTWYVSRRRRAGGPREIWREQALDDVEEGLETDFTRDAERAQAGAAAKFRRGVRLGADGPGVEVEIAALTRFRLRRL